VDVQERFVVISRIIKLRLWWRLEGFHCRSFSSV